MTPEELAQRVAVMAAREKLRAPRRVPKPEDDGFRSMGTFTRDGDSERGEPHSGYPQGNAEIMEANDTGTDRGLGESRTVTEGDAGRTSALDGAESDTVPRYEPFGGRGSPLDQTEALVPGTGPVQTKRGVVPKKAGPNGRRSPAGGSG